MYPKLCHFKWVITHDELRPLMDSSDPQTHGMKCEQFVKQMPRTSLKFASLPELVTVFFFFFFFPEEDVYLEPSPVISGLVETAALLSFLKYALLICLGKQRHAKSSYSLCFLCLLVGSAFSNFWLFPRFTDRRKDQQNPY